VAQSDCPSFSGHSYGPTRRSATCSIRYTEAIPAAFCCFGRRAQALKGIGTNGKEEAPSLAIVDGQQRLTSLYAVMTGAEVIRAGYSRERIKIAFDPRSERFEVANAATAQDRAFISNVADVWASGANAFQLANDYLFELGKVRELTQHPFNASSEKFAS
jgi:hypothetical protein